VKGFSEMFHLLGKLHQGHGGEDSSPENLQEESKQE
jgi:hypothetical protein